MEGAKAASAWALAEDQRDKALEENRLLRQQLLAASSTPLAKPLAPLESLQPLNALHANVVALHRADEELLNKDRMVLVLERQLEEKERRLTHDAAMHADREQMWLRRLDAANEDIRHLSRELQFARIAERDGREKWHEAQRAANTAEADICEKVNAAELSESALRQTKGSLEHATSRVVHLADELQSLGDRRQKDIEMLELKWHEKYTALTLATEAEREENKQELVAQREQLEGKIAKMTASWEEREQDYINNVMRLTRIKDIMDIAIDRRIEKSIDGLARAALCAWYSETRWAMAERSVITREREWRKYHEERCQQLLLEVNDQREAAHLADLHWNKQIDGAHAQLDRYEQQLQSLVPKSALDALQDQVHALRADQIRAAESHQHISRELELRIKHDARLRQRQRATVLDFMLRHFLPLRELGEVMTAWHTCVALRKARACEEQNKQKDSQSSRNMGIQATVPYVDPMWGVPVGGSMKTAEGAAKHHVVKDNGVVKRVSHGSDKKRGPLQAKRETERAGAQSSPQDVCSAVWGDKPASALQVLPVVARKDAAIQTQVLEAAEDERLVAITARLAAQVLDKKKHGRFHDTVAHRQVRYRICALILTLWRWNVFANALHRTTTESVFRTHFFKARKVRFLHAWRSCVLRLQRLRMTFAPLVGVRRCFDIWAAVAACGERQTLHARMVCGLAGITRIRMRDAWRALLMNAARGTMRRGSVGIPVSQRSSSDSQMTLFSAAKTSYNQSSYALIDSFVRKQLRQRKTTTNNESEHTNARLLSPKALRASTPSQGACSLPVARPGSVFFAPASKVADCVHTPEVGAPPSLAASSLHAGREQMSLQRSSGLAMVETLLCNPLLHGWEDAPVSPRSVRTTFSVSTPTVEEEIMNDEKEDVMGIEKSDRPTVAALWPEASVMVAPKKRAIAPSGWHAAQSTQTPRMGQSTQTDATIARARTKARTLSPTPSPFLSSPAGRPAPAARPSCFSMLCDKRAESNHVSCTLRAAHRNHAPIPVEVKNSRRTKSTPTFFRTPPSTVASALSRPSPRHHCPRSPVPPPSVVDLPLPPRVDPEYTTARLVRPPSASDLPQPPHPDPWYAPTSPGGPPTLSHTPLSTPSVSPLFQRMPHPTNGSRARCNSPPLPPSYPLISFRPPSRRPPSSPPLSPLQFHQLSEAWRAKPRTPDHDQSYPHAVPTAARLRKHTPVRVPLPPAPLTCPATQPLRQEFEPSPPVGVAPLLPPEQTTAAAIADYLQSLCDVVRSTQQHASDGNQNAACPGHVPVATPFQAVKQEGSAKDVPDVRCFVETSSLNEVEHGATEGRVRGRCCEQELENDEKRALQRRLWRIQQTRERTKQREEMEMTIAELEEQIAQRVRATEEKQVKGAFEPLRERVFHRG